MATYLEMQKLSNDSELLNRCVVATLIAVVKVRQEADDVPNHAARLTWAAKVVKDAREAATVTRWAVIYAMREQSIDALSEANMSDAQLQEIVDQSIDLMAA